MYMREWFHYEDEIGLMPEYRETSFILEQNSFLLLSAEGKTNVCCELVTTYKTIQLCCPSMWKLVFDYTLADYNIRT